MQDLVIQKNGPGRLYYRVALSCAPADLNIPEARFGFTVSRTYYPVDEPKSDEEEPSTPVPVKTEEKKSVYKDSDGIWRVTKGKLVRVEVTMVTTIKRFNIALVDNLPGGLEAENPAIKTGSQASITELDKHQTQKTESWFQHVSNY